MMHLMFGKLPLLAYDGRVLGRRHPAADTFELLVDQLSGVELVTQMEIADRPSVFAFEVLRTERAPLLVLWDQRDQIAGDNEPAVPVSVPWDATEATSVDAFGEAHAVSICGSELRVDVSTTPVFITAEQQRVYAEAVD